MAKKGFEMSFKSFCGLKANSAISITYETYSFMIWSVKYCTKNKQQNGKKKNQQPNQPKQTRKQNRNCSVSGWKKGLTEKCT